MLRLCLHWLGYDETVVGVNVAERDRRTTLLIPCPLSTAHAGLEPQLLAESSLQEASSQLTL